MSRVNASFELRLLGSTSADRADVDKALAIFIKNTSALLRTKTNQIRQKTAAYKAYLEGLHREFAERLGNQPTIRVNGPEADSLIVSPANPPARSPEFRAGQYIAMFAAVVAIAGAAIYVLKIPPSSAIPMLIALVAVFGGIVAISSGKAFEVFEGAIQLLRGGKQKLRYPQPEAPSKNSGQARPRLQNKKKGSEIEKPDKLG